MTQWSCTLKQAILHSVTWCLFDAMWKQIEQLGSCLKSNIEFNEYLTRCDEARSISRQVFMQSFPSPELLKKLALREHSILNGWNLN